jgi:hypothetical protein
LDCIVTAYTLVVSNPPHGEVDVVQAAPSLGLAPAELRMKANYPVPEIWLAGEDASEIEAAAGELEATGLTVAVVAGDRLRDAPQRTAAKGFSFGDGALVAHLDGSDLELPYDVPLIGVYCTPKQAVVEESRRGGGGGLADGLGRRSSSVFMTRDSLVGFGGLGGRASSVGGGEGGGQPESSFLDVYVSGEGGPQRVGIVQDVVDFGGLGDLQLTNPTANLEMFVAEFEERFARASVDRRLLDMQPRQRPMVGKPKPGTPERKGFSYATEALAKLLESISPDLKDLSQFELCSRLVYLTTH